MVNYGEYRPKRVVTVNRAANEIGKSVRQVQRYENTDEPTNIPSDIDVVKLARLYGSSLLVFEHFGHNNDIGKRFFCRPLNQINRSFPAMCFKSQEELKEMVNAMEGMCRMVLNEQSLEKWSMVEDFDRCFLELIDVEQLILEAKIRYAEIRGLKALEERYKEHDEKCLRNGYRVDIDKKITPQAAEARAQYQIS